MGKWVRVMPLRRVRSQCPTSPYRPSRHLLSPGAVPPGAALRSPLFLASVASPGGPRACRSAHGFGSHGCSAAHSPRPPGW
jgi:hypothetical protein